MTEKEAISRLHKIAEIHANDNEVAHAEADDVLLVFLFKNGHKTVAMAWLEVKDKITFWYT